MEYPKFDLISEERLPLEKEFIRDVLVKYLIEGKSPIEIENEYCAKDISTGALAVKVLNNFGLISSKQEFDNKGIFTGESLESVISYLKNGNDNSKTVANAMSCIPKVEDHGSESELIELEKFEKYYKDNLVIFKSNIELYDEIRVRNEFVIEYPLERIKNLTLEEYALGTPNSKDSLCHKLEFGKYLKSGLPVAGYSSGKHGIYFSKKGTYCDYNNEAISDPEEYWVNFRNQLYNFLIEIGENNIIPDVITKYPLIKNIPGLATKLCYLYYPNHFISIGKRDVLIELVDKFSINCDDVYSPKLSFELSKYLKENIPVLSEDDPLWIGVALWRYKDYNPEQSDSKSDEDEIKDYSADQFKNDVFIPDSQYEDIVSLLNRKKNIILTGAPGVGKTFMAKKLVYSLQGNTDKSRMLCIQFHQSYSYEDFIEGYRPTNNGFELQKGIFYKLCKKAEKDLENNYYLIIDEINRGNLSKIFGELLMLIESDKRGKKLTLAYSEESFSVPENLHIIGLMNTADRSLALIDYALRRRFSFIRIEPAFDNKKFRRAFEEKFDSNFNQVLEIIKKINEAIEDDKSLGSGFKIGHSYFCPNLKDRKGNKKDIQDIITYEIIPLLEEYWYDEEDSLLQWRDALNGVIND